MTLTEACLLIADCPHTTARDEGEGYPLVRTPNVGFGRLEYEGMHRVSQSVYDCRNKRAVPKSGDLIYAREAPAGNVAVIEPGEEVCLGQRTVLLRPNPRIVDSYFLAYYLLMPEHRNELVGQASGATVLHVNLADIRSLKVAFPNLDAQKRIVAIVNDYYAAIANCRKQIALLEEAVLRLYREWFGDGKGEDGRIGDFVKIKRGKVITKANAVVGSVPVIAAGTAPAYYNDKANVFGPSVTISASGANAGYVWFHPEDIWASDCSYVSRSESPYVYFCYVMLLSKQQEISKQQRGSAQPHVHTSDVEGLSFVIPEIVKVEKFERCVTPQFEMIGDLSRQIRSLTEARDRLLPKLMKGEIEA